MLWEPWSLGLVLQVRAWGVCVRIVSGLLACDCG